MKKLVLLTAMFTIFMASHSAIACTNNGADRNSKSAVKKNDKVAAMAREALRRGATK